MTACFDFARPDPDLVQQIAVFSTATIHESYGQKGALPHYLKPVAREMQLCGAVLSVFAPAGDNLALHIAIDGARPGDILVVDHEGSLDDGPFGDIMAEACMAKGIAGLVIDGCVRDASTIRKMGFPVFSRGLCIRGTAKREAGRVGLPIHLGGIEVGPGDVICGDEDGLVVVKAPDLLALIAKCADREQKEALLRREIHAGKTTLDLLDLRRML